MKNNYFLGGTSPVGFRSKFINQINKPGYYTYILKGGPGTGKSTLMKKIASLCDESCCDLYYCSSDIRSLDAVVLNDKKIIIVDGTSPHTFDPVYPGVSQEIINLGRFWNKEHLTLHQELIKYYSDENTKYHKKAARYLRSAASLLNNIFNISENALLKEKLNSYSERFAARLFREYKKSECISPEFRQLSSFTSYGYLTREIPEDYTVYVLNDDMFAGTDSFIRKISEKASEYGVKTLISECSAFEGSVYEHMIIPELKTAFMSSNFLNKNKYENCLSVNFSRFYDRSLLSKKKTHISFDKKLVTEIVSAATEEIDTALSIHNELEKFYIDSLNIEGLIKFTDEFVNMIL